MPELLEFAAEHHLKIVSIEDLIEYRVRTESFVQRVATLPPGEPLAACLTHVFGTPFDAMQHLAIVFGDIADGKNIPCRIRHEQPLSDLFMHSADNASTDWLSETLQRFEQHGRGVLIYLRDAKLSAAGSASGDEEHDSARQRMRRWRDIGLGAQILRELGISSIALIATDQRHYVGLGGFGIDILDTEIVDL